MDACRYDRTDATLGPTTRVRANVESHHFHGIDVRAYRRTYANAPDSVTFCGGLNDKHAGCTGTTY